MGNKLKDIFNENEVQNTLRVSFADEKAGKAFAASLQKVYQTGEPQKIEGIEKITAGCTDGTGHYAKDQMADAADIMIYPNKKEETFPVQTKYGEQMLELLSYAVEDGVVIETKEDFPVDVWLRMDRKTESCQFKFQYKPSRSESIEQIVKSYVTLYAYLKKVFLVKEEDKEYLQWSEICKQFENEITFFEKAWAVEKRLGQTFVTSYMKSASEEEWRECVLDIEELYTTLILGKAARLAAKLNATEQTCVYLEKDQQMETGKSIELTFTGKVTYRIFGEEISLYTANLLCNAVVKEVRHSAENGKKTMVWYGDKDSNPMYLAYTVHQTEDAAKQEAGQIMEHAERYRNAGK